MTARDEMVGSGNRAGRVLLSAVAWAGYAFLMLPTLIVIPMSFGGRFEMTFPPKSFSTFLYEQFLFTSNWMDAVVMSLKVATSAAVLAVIVGVPAAYSIVRGNYPGKRLLSLLLLSPMFVPVIVIALGFYLYFARLHLTGSTVGLILAHTAYIVPYVTVTCIAGMRHVDPGLERAAAIMGASPRQIFLRVVLPLLRPAILSGALFAFLMSFDEVVIAYFISSADTMTLSVKMFSTIRWEMSPVLAAASAFLTVLSLVVCLTGAMFQKKS
jgi:putative spermidine/putrescine transport system permease protein